jgi:hypothetical protein
MMWMKALSGVRRVKSMVSRVLTWVLSSSRHVGLEPESRSACVVLDGPRVKPGVTIKE